MEKEKTNLSNGRLLSIDALRGFDAFYNGNQRNHRRHLFALPGR